MAKRLTLQQWAEDEGFTDASEAVSDLDLIHDSIVPALCEDGCEVEPDGKCEHGHPSVIDALLFN